MNVKDIDVEINWKGRIENKNKSEFLQKVWFLFKDLNFRIDSRETMTIFVPIADVVDFTVKFTEKEKK